MKHFKFKSIKSNNKIRNKTNTFLFYLMCVLTLSLTVGYAAINSDVSVSGEASFRTIEEMRISDVRMHQVTNAAIESYSSRYNKDTVITGIDLPYTNSTITYKVSVTNYGSVVMKISSITNESFNNNDMEYTTSGYTLNTFVSPGQTVELYITFRYKNAVTTIPATTTLDSSIKLTYQKPESVLAQGNSGGATSTFFNNGPIQKGQVEKITFRPTLDVGEGALGYWDASKDIDGSVIAWYTDTDSNNLYELYIGGMGEVQLPVNSSYLFRNFTKVTSIDFQNYIKTDNVTNMAGMFKYCSLLEKLDLTSFNTSKVTVMADSSNNGMFESCSKLTEILFSDNFETSNVTIMSYVFYGCSSLTTLDLSSFDTSKVTTMLGMFEKCTALKELDLSNFNTSNVTNISSIFSQCSSLVSLDVSGWTNDKITDMSTLFKNLSNLETLNLSNFKTPAVTTMSSMFSGSQKLKTLNLSSFDTSNVTTMYSMFWNCKKLENLNVSSFNTAKVTNIEYMFDECSSLTELNLSNFNTSNVTHTGSIFSGCSSLVSLDVSGWTNDKITNMSNLFKNLLNLETLNLSNFKTPAVTNMSSMFSGLQKLKTLDLSSFDTSKVTTMSSMFSGLLLLETINLSSFDTSNVTTMYSMFWNCKKLENLNVSSFNTTKVTNTAYMFGECSSLTNLDIRNFDFTSVTDHSNTFTSMPANSLITVKDQTAKDWVLSKRSDFTNIITVAELPSS